MAQEATIDSLLAEIARSGGAGSGGSFPSDTMTAAILERLREEVARVYQEGVEGGSGVGGGGGGGGSSGEPAASHEGASPRARVQVRHPLPVELWRRAHEVEGKQKPVRSHGLGLEVAGPRGGDWRPVPVWGLSLLKPLPHAPSTHPHSTHSTTCRPLK